MHHCKKINAMKLVDPSCTIISSDDIIIDHPK